MTRVEYSDQITKRSRMKMRRGRPLRIPNWMRVGLGLERRSTNRGGYKINTYVLAIC
jgi:hypothetical protein